MLTLISSIYRLNLPLRPPLAERWRLKISLSAKKNLPQRSASVTKSPNSDSSAEHSRGELILHIQSQKQSWQTLSLIGNRLMVRTMVFGTINQGSNPCSRAYLVRSSSG